jgi:hypothetical protein
MLVFLDKNYEYNKINNRMKSTSESPMLFNTAFRYIGSKETPHSTVLNWDLFNKHMNDGAPKSAKVNKRNDSIIKLFKNSFNISV